MDAGTTWLTVSSTLPSPTTSLTVASTGTIQFRVRAVDVAGNIGAWTMGRVITPRLVQDSSSAISYGSDLAERSSDRLLRREPSGPRRPKTHPPPSSATGKSIRLRDHEGVDQRQGADLRQRPGGRRIEPPQLHHQVPRALRGRPPGTPPRPERSRSSSTKSRTAHPSTLTRSLSSSSPRVPAPGPRFAGPRRPHVRGGRARERLVRPVDGLLVLSPSPRPGLPHATPRRAKRPATAPTMRRCTS